MLDHLMLALLAVIQLCSQLKAFSILRSVEESLDIRLDNQEHLFLKTLMTQKWKRLMVHMLIEYGNLRQHIWTFANPLDEYPWFYDHKCPCTNVIEQHPISIPSFIGNDYFCETGVPPGQQRNITVFYADDPLWDGQGCGPTSTCCTFNNPPWFCKQLPQSTNADLEVRLCSAGAASIENTPIELIEIYVK